MKLGIFFIGLIILLGFGGVSFADADTAKPASKNPPKVVMAPLQATISESRFLPPAMYGEWSVTATLLETNYPGFFAPLVHDIWILEETNHEVTIRNAANGASATISVDEVVGNTATFHRIVEAGEGRRITEQPTVTVSGDRLNGKTMDQYEVFANGNYKVFYCKYHLEAERIGGARVHFGETLDGDHEFEIQEVPMKPQPKAFEK